MVDHPAGAPAALYEGRLLPRDRALDYAQFVGPLKERGWTVNDRWGVLRDGERPRSAWMKPALFAVLILVALVNLRALAIRLLG
jgi:hypothetical protein